jgi:hypothetical protein
LPALPRDAVQLPASDLGVSPRRGLHPSRGDVHCFRFASRASMSLRSVSLQFGAASACW